MMRCATALQSLASISAHALRQTLGQPLWRSRWRRLVVARCRTRLRLRRGLRRRQQGGNDFAHLRAVGFLRLLELVLSDEAIAVEVGLEEFLHREGRQLDAIDHAILVGVDLAELA